jgi:hypothetical protein
MGLILLIVLVVLLLGAAPIYGYSRPWGYRPVSLLGLVLIFLLVLVFFDVLSLGFGLHHPWHRVVVVHEHRVQ